MRVEIHLPPGRAIGGDGSDFDINTSKSSVGIAYTLLEQLREWAKNPGEKFHPADPSVLSLQKRAILRNGQDKWPKCGFCGSEDHKKANCPERPRCPVCNSVRHADIRKCPRRPPCATCGTRDHITEDHPREASPTPRTPTMGNAGNGPQLSLLSAPGGRKTPQERATSTPAEHRQARRVSVNRARSGPVISARVVNDRYIVDVNIDDPLYTELHRQLVELSQADV